ncbi:MAG: ABC transporter permease [Planctomycetaceae bacterium]
MSTAPLPVASAREVPPSDEASHVVVIEPRSGWAALDLLELWRFRELAYYLAWRDVKVRYKQTVLGAAWAIIQPLTLMLIFTFLRTVLTGRGADAKWDKDYPYHVFLYAALLPWQFFSFCVTQSSLSLVGSANLISKIHFPRLLIPLATVGVGILDFLISSLILIGMLVYYQVAPGLHVLVLPVILLGLLLASIGVGTWLSALAVTYRDVRYVVPFLTQIWLFATPVLYQLDRVPEKWRLLYCVNPTAGLISSFRSCLLGDPLNWTCLAISLLSSMVVFVCGSFYFRKVERRFADIV